MVSDLGAICLTKSEYFLQFIVREHLGVDIEYGTWAALLLGTWKTPIYTFYLFQYHCRETAVFTVYVHPTVYRGKYP